MTLRIRDKIYFSSLLFHHFAYLYNTNDSKKDKHAMSCTIRIPGIMLHLVIFLLVLNLSSCGIIKTESSQRDDDRDWGKNIPTGDPFHQAVFTLKPFDWDRFILKPRVWDRSTVKPFHSDRFTVKPFDWDRFTVKPFDWDRFTLKPFDWDRFTVKPIDWDKINIPKIDVDSYKYNNDDAAIKVAIYLPCIFIIILISICRYACKTQCDTNTTDTSTPILHAPPTVTVPPSSNRRQPSQNRREPVSQHTSANLSSLRRDLFSTVSDNTYYRLVEPLSSNRTEQVPQNTGASNNPIANDKPPAYSEVIIADLSAGETNFPEVRATVPDTPPPKYDEEKLMRY